MNILHEILRGVWFIEPGYAEKYLPLVVAMLKGSAVNTDESESKPNEQPAPDIYNKTHVVDKWSVLYYPQMITEPSIFSLDIFGPITKYDQYCGPMGIRSKANILKAADNHPNIFAHIILIDSGGGEGYAGRLMANQIQRLKKPVIAFVEDFACSAAYMIASAANHIVANSKMARIGSIGTYISIVDYSEYFKKEGIKINDIYADKSSDKNQDYLKAIKGDDSQIKKLANQFNDFFLDTIIQNREHALTSDQWNTGKVFFAEEARQIGLIDDVASFEDVIQSMSEQYIH